MLLRSVRLLALFTSVFGLNVQRDVPKDHAKVLHVAKAEQQALSRYYEDLGVTAGLKAKLDPFKSGNENLWLVSVETRLGKEFPLEGGDYEATYQKGYENVFEEVIAGGLNTSSVPKLPLKAKAKILSEWAETHAKQYPEDLVLYLDHDTVYVGCPEEQLLADVHAILAHSDADLITGAELNCAQRTVWESSRYHCAIQPGTEERAQYQISFENWLRKNDRHGNDTELMSQTVYPEVPPWATSLYSLTDRMWQPHATNREFLHLGKLKPQPRFLNSGLVVGRARHFARMFSWLTKSHAEGGYANPFSKNWFNDQHGFNMAYYDTVNGNTEVHAGVKITLDFGTRLMFNLYGSSIDNPPYARLPDGTYQNKFTGKPVCFIHGNGKLHYIKEAFYKIENDIIQNRPDLLLENFGGKRR